MGQLVEGAWQRGPLVKTDRQGAFVRAPSGFRGAVTADGAPGPDGRSFPAETGRYHLYVSYACPFAHRTLLARSLRGLTHVISCDVVEAYMGEDGWAFRVSPQMATAGATGDSVAGRTHLHQVYTAADPEYTGRVSVPVLWDKKTNDIVSTESADIVRMFDDAFDVHAASSAKLAPLEDRARIDELNRWLFQAVTNGVYRCGFATTQNAYEEAFDALFAALDDAEERLRSARFLCGATPNEADWRLFVTLVRFDAVYVQHFRCNKRRIVDYPNLGAYLRDLYQQPAVADTVHMQHIKRHYYLSHPHLNPRGLVPKGPELDFEAPAGRANLVTGAASASAPARKEAP